MNMSIDDNIPLLCLDIIKKIRKKQYSSTREDLHGFLFTPKVVINSKIIIINEIDTMTCCECNYTRPVDNDFFQEYIERNFFHSCDVCKLYFSDKELHTLCQIYDSVKKFKFEILDYKELNYCDRSEVYKSKIIIQDKIFYGLILCDILEEPNEVSSSPCDYFSYITFIFKDIDILDNQYNTLELITNYYI